MKIAIYRPYETFGMIDTARVFDNIDDAFSYANKISEDCDSLDFCLDSNLLCYGIDQEEYCRLSSDLGYMRDILEIERGDDRWDTLTLEQAHTLLETNERAFEQLMQDSGFAMIIECDDRDTLETIRDYLR